MAAIIAVQDAITGDKHGMQGIAMEVTQHQLHLIRRRNQAVLQMHTKVVALVYANLAMRLL